MILKGCHCEERSDEAISYCAKESVFLEGLGIASLRQKRLRSQ
jgi:hypothetical protein